MSAFRRPSATSARTSSSPAREMRRGSPAVERRGPRGMPRAPRSRSRRATMRCERAGAEPLELREGLAAAPPRRRPRTGPAPPRRGGRVRATRRPPRASRRRAGATTARRSCRGSLRRSRSCGASSASSPSHHDEAGLSISARYAALGRLGNASGRPLEPCNLGPRHTARAACQPGSLAAAAIAAAPASNGAVVGVAAPGSYEREHEQRLKARLGRVADLGDDHVRGRRRVRPVLRDPARAEPAGRATPAARGRARGPRSARAPPRSTARPARASLAPPTRARGCAWRARRAGADAAPGPRRAPARAAVRRRRGTARPSRALIERVDPLLVSPNRRASSSVRSLHATTASSSPRYAETSAIALVASASSGLSGRLLEHGDRAGGGVLGLGQEAAAHQVRHEPAPRGRLAIDRAGAAVVLDRALELRDRRHLVVGEIQGVRPTLEQRRALLRREAAGEAERARVLRRRLAMRAEPRGLLGGGRCVPQHGLGVGGGLGVMGDPGEVGRAASVSVSASRTARCSASRRVGDSVSSTAARASSCRNATPPPAATRTPQARHSSTESDASPHTASVSSASSDGGAIDAASTTAARRRAQLCDTGEHDVAHRRGNLGSPASEHLGHVERIARRQVGGARRRRRRVPAASCATPSADSGASAQPHDRPARSRARRGRCAADESGRARRRGRWRARAIDASPILLPSTRTTSSVASSAQCMSSSTSTPGRPGRHRVEQRRSDRVRAALVDRVGDGIPAASRGDLEERPERRRRQQRVASAPADRGASAELVGEEPRQRGLADAGLAADEDEPAATVARASSTPHGETPAARLARRTRSAASRRPPSTDRTPGAGCTSDRSGLNRECGGAEHGTVTALLERDELLAALVAAATHGGRLVFVGGEAGRRQDDARARVRRADGRRVLRGSCENLATPDAARPVRGHRGPDRRRARRAARRRSRSARGRARPPRASSPSRRSSSSRTSTGPTRRRWTRCGCSAGASTRREGLVVATYRDDEVEGGHALRTVLGELASAPGVSRLDGAAALARGRARARGAVRRRRRRDPCADRGERVLRHRDPGGRLGFPAGDGPRRRAGPRRLARAGGAAPARRRRARPGEGGALAARGGCAGRARPARQLPCRRRPPRGRRGGRVPPRARAARAGRLRPGRPPSTPPRRAPAMVYGTGRRPAGTPRASRTTPNGRETPYAVLEYAPEAARRAAAAASHREAAQQYARALRFAGRPRRARPGRPARPLRARGAADGALRRGRRCLAGGHRALSRGRRPARRGAQPRVADEGVHPDRAQCRGRSGEPGSDRGARVGRAGPRACARVCRTGVRAHAEPRQRGRRHVGQALGRAGGATRRRRHPRVRAHHDRHVVPDGRRDRDGRRVPPAEPGDRPGARPLAVGRADAEHARQRPRGDVRARAVGAIPARAHRPHRRARPVAALLARMARRSSRRTPAAGTRRPRPPRTCSRTRPTRSAGSAR